MGERLLGQTILPGKVENLGPNKETEEFRQALKIRTAELRNALRVEKEVHAATSETRVTILVKLERLRQAMGFVGPPREEDVLAHARSLREDSEQLGRLLPRLQELAERWMEMGPRWRPDNDSPTCVDAARAIRQVIEEVKKR